jgi:hypothetical protein
VVKWVKPVKLEKTPSPRLRRPEKEQREPMKQSSNSNTTDQIMKSRINKYLLAATIVTTAYAASTLTSCAPKYACYGDAGRVIEPVQVTTQPVTVQVERGAAGE